jgi:hypothetical protein
MILTLPAPINVSLQSKLANIVSGNISEQGAWDIIYFARMNTGNQNGQVYRLGKCTGINTVDETTYAVTVEPDTTAQTPDTNDFIFFGKDNQVGTAGVTGYYAQIEMKNDSIDYAELFAVSSEVTQSSK